MPPDNQRKRKLDAVVDRLQLKYGAKAIRHPEPPQAPQVASISTTFPQLDQALGIGGLPKGRISEIDGPATSGKTTLAAKLIASAHRDSAALAAWIDLGATSDPDYLYRCGVALDRLLVVRPHEAADALAITLHLVESSALAVLIFDGLAALDPDMEPLLAGTLARLATLVTRTETAVIFLSEPHAQNRSLAHLAFVRLSITRERWISQGKDIRGYEGHVQILKSRVGKAGAVVPIRITINGVVQGDGL